MPVMLNQWTAINARVLKFMTWILSRYLHKRTGPVHLGAHILGPFCPNPESTARIPASAENLAERFFFCWGGGGGGGGGGEEGGGLVHFAYAPESVLHFSSRGTWNPASYRGKNNWRVQIC